MSDIGLLMGGLIALFVGGDALVTGATRLARSLGISAAIVAITVIAAGTSMPELVVAVNASQEGTSTLALGNVIGSNIVNIGLILGLSAVIAPLIIDRRLIRREIPINIAATVLAIVLGLDGEFSQVDGIILLVAFVAFMVYSVRHARHQRRATLANAANESANNENDDNNGENNQDTRRDVRRVRELIRLVLGVALVVFGAEWTVQGATAIARSLGVSELVIGLTLIAFGTGLPELASSLIAAWRKHTDVIIGNIIGSNIANLLLILGAAGVVNPIPVGEGARQFQLPIVLGFALLLVPFTLDGVITRREGILLIVLYAAFIIVTFVV